jgi:hypothetical protein
MSSMIWDYGRMLVLVCSAAALYEFTAVPLIEPPASTSAAAAADLGYGQVAYWWHDFFEPKSWQRKNPKVLETEQGILLFQSWERMGSRRWRLNPLTILIPPKDRVSPSDDSSTGSKRPILIDAPEGAIIQFKDDMDIFSGHTPPLEGGQLVGKIQIHSPGNNPDNSDAVDIRTEMVRIDRRRIWTSQQVEMQVGRSYAKGRHLSIFLDKNLLASSVDTGTSWDGLDRLELIYVDEIRAELPPGGLFGETLSKSMQLPPDQPPILARPAQVSITCSGAFRFDFRNSLAQLQDNVKIIHQVEGLPPDKFECGALRLYVDRVLETAPSTVATADNGKPSILNGQPLKLGPLQLRKVEAEGASAGNAQAQSPYVTFEAPAMGTRGVARWLSMDLVKQQLSWMNRLPTEPAHPEHSYIKHAGTEFWTPELHYRYDGKSNHLGWLAAAGPGNAAMAVEGQGRWEIGWNKSLQMVPDGDDERITMEGDVIVRNEQQGRFAASMIDVWLRSFNKTEIATSKPSGSLSQWLPDRLEAVGKVEVSTTELIGNFSQMALWFAYVLPGSEGSSVNADAGLQLNAPGGQTGPAWIKPPTATATTLATPNVLSPSPPKVAGPPARITGHRLHGRLLRTQKEMLIDDLTIQGGVVLKRDSIDPSNPLPVVIEGDQLRMSTAEGGMADIAVSGQPARIFVGQGWLDGPVVRVNQKDHLVWIDEPGSFGVPLEAMQKPGTAGVAQGAATNTMRWIEAPRCRWQGRMMFDGKVARMDGGVDFFGRVQTNADTVWHIEGSSSMLEITLNQMLGEPSSGGKLEIQTVALTENVDLRAAQTDVYGVRRSTEHMVVPSLVLDATTQRMLASGPGSIRSRRPSSSRLGQPSASLASQRPTELTCLHLTFAGELEGFLDRMEFIFSRQIEVGMGPILNWDETLDVANLQQLTPGQMLMSCERLKVFEASQIPSVAVATANGSSSLGVWDLEAEQSVVFEGRTATEVFSGSAAKLGYQAAKDSVRIIGLPRQAAILQRIPQAEPPAKLSVRDATFRLKTMEIIDMQLEQFQVDLQGGGLGGSTNLPAAPVNNGSPRDALFQRRP